MKVMTVQVSDSLFVEHMASVLSVAFGARRPAGGD
jgi:hypothetical protein